MQHPTIETLKQVAIGDTILYKLLPHQLPRDPNKQWYGLVKKNISVAHLFVVTITEYAEQDVEDFVRYEQVVEVHSGQVISKNKDN